MSMIDEGVLHAFTKIAGSITDAEYKKLEQLGVFDTARANMRSQAKGGKDWDKDLPPGSLVKRRMKDQLKGGLVGGAALGLLGGALKGRIGGIVGGLAGMHVGGLANQMRNDRKFWEKKGLYHDPLMIRARVTPEAKKKYIDAYLKKKK